MLKEYYFYDKEKESDTYVKRKKVMNPEIKLEQLAAHILDNWIRKR